MHELNIDPIELIELTELLSSTKQRVFEDQGNLVVSNGEIHYHLSENQDGTFTVRANERNPLSEKTWEADLANSSYALRYLLLAVHESFREAQQPRLRLVRLTEALPAGASITEVAPDESGRPSGRNMLYLDGHYVGTFGYMVDAAARLLPLTLDELAPIFRDTTRVTL